MGHVLNRIVPNTKGLALVIILLFSLLGTELMSNTSMASIMLPIADSVVLR